MKAAEFYRYGNVDVLKVIDTEIPTPKKNEVLVKIHATSVTATEAAFRKGNPYMVRLFMGLRKPKINRLGEELVGEVQAVGNDVTLFKKGQQVFGTAGPNFGANAEYICIPENGVITSKPSSLSINETAGSIDGFLTALPFLRDTGKVKANQKVLIYGASGSVGAAAVQAAKYLGAEVTAVCSGKNIELVTAIGADYTIDYTKEDFSLKEKKYDVIFDTVNKIKFKDIKKALSKKGLFLEAGISLSIFPSVIWTALFGKQKVKIAATGMRPEKERLKDLVLLKELLESETIKPVIDKVFNLNNISLAHAYVDSGRKKGNVVLVVE